MNQTRKTFIASFILAVIAAGSVQISQIAYFLDNKGKYESTIRRIELFFQKFPFPEDLFVRFWFSFLKSDKVILTMDRTNRQFGDININILMLAARFQGLAIPLFFILLNKRGNSNQNERVELMKKYIDMFGVDSIVCLTADREFIGDTWLSWLKENKIPFAIRIKKNMIVTLSSGKQVYAHTLLKPEYKKQDLQGITVLGVKTNLYIEKIENDFLIIIGDFLNNELSEYYRMRWSIETLFQALKGRGFHLESTHITAPDRLTTLFTLVFTAYALCLEEGIAAAAESPIPLKKNGRPKVSLFRHGLNILKMKVIQKLSDFIKVFLEKNPIYKEEFSVLKL